MHHRRRSRRRDKRTMLPCGCCEDIRSKGPQIEENEVCNGKAKKAKKAPVKKSRCPKGGAHKWYREWIAEKDFKRELLNYCAVCEVENEKWIAERERWLREYGWTYNKWSSPYRSFWCQMHGTKKWFVRRRKVATCINCWEVKIEKITDNYFELFPNENRWYTHRKMVLPRRPVKV